MDMARRLAAKYGEAGVRSTVVLPGFTGDVDSTRAYEEAKGHMTALMKTERAAQQAVANPDPRLYDIGNVTLFLAGDMGAGVSGAVVARMDHIGRSDCRYH
ncbi:hypothetical protein TI39_contig5855g00001 [Zymoseptoria brevis]|uniref:Uncharacterized protein n=1 Tax=Zymoseptoria brevis TaxID=1047168 RepID=A0A0F4G4Z0_9PEZI|nr:hypothetical protein TI39_contig5855g00001 [Zymoseptoria brevis]